MLVALAMKTQKIVVVCEDNPVLTQCELNLLLI